MFSRGVKAKPKAAPVKKFNIPMSWLESKEDPAPSSIEKLEETTASSSINEEMPVKSDTTNNDKTLIETAEKPKSKPSIQSKGSKGTLAETLSKLKNQNKVSSLQKSREQWDSFTKEENLESELEANKKDGYLQKITFLQETDFRQFELEKEVRNRERRKRG